MASLAFSGGAFFILLFFFFLLRDFNTFVSKSKYLENISKIFLPLGIENQFIQELINSQFEEVIYKDDHPEHINIEAKKCGEILFDHFCDRIDIEIPLDLQVSKKTLLANLQGKAKLNIKFQVDYHLRYDWTLTSDTKIIGYNWIEPPSLGLGEIHFSAKKLGDTILKRSQVLLAKTIDDVVANKGNLKKFIVPKWNGLMKPILLNSKYKIWLDLKPSNLSFIPLSTQGVSMQSGINIETSAHVFIGESPKSRELTPLPDFFWKNVSEKGFELSFPIFVSMDAIRQILIEQVQGRIIEKQGYKIQIDSIDASFNSNFLNITAIFSGSIDGKFNFMGIPRIKIDKHQLVFDQMEYNIDPKGFLMGLAVKVFKKKIASTIENATIIELDQFANKGILLVNQKLEEIDIEHVHIDGNLEILKLHNVQIENDIMRIDAFLKGDGEVRVS